MCKKTITIKTSFADAYPEYSKFWCSSNNKNPSDVSYSSHKLFSFVCKNGHTTKKSPNKISSLKNKDFICKECKNKNFAEVYPEYAKHWSSKNNIEPTNVISGSCSNFYFTCINGHTFQKTPNYLSKLKSSKFFCSDCNKTSFSEVFPEYTKFWSTSNNISPDDVSSRSHKFFEFVCKSGHIIKKTPKNLFDLKDKSFICNLCEPTRSYKYKKRKSFAEEYPAYTKHWSPDNKVSPENVTSGSTKKYTFICEKGHVLEKKPISISRLKNQTFHCAKCKFVTFLEAYPDYAKHWSPDNDTTPELVSSASGKSLLFICEYGHSTTKTPNKISKLKNKEFNCPDCNKVSFAEEYPSLLPYWSSTNKESPHDIPPSSRKSFDFICVNGHVMKKKLSYISKGEQLNCSICDGTKISYDTRLDISYPLLLKEWDYYKNKKTPDLYSSRSNKKVWWKCERNHSWSAVISSRTGEKNNIYGGGKCPYCYTKSKSRPELILFSELHQFFKNVTSGYNLDGKELDIYIEDIKFGIEYDGHYYHKNKLKLDKLKNSICDKKNINLLRIREKGLRRISKHDYIYNPQSDLFDVVSYILKYIVNNYKLSKKKNEQIQKYIKNKKATNELFFESILYKNMVKEVKSKAKLNCYSDLNPLGIHYYGNNSKYKAIWECPHCNNSWKSSIKSFTMKSCDSCGNELKNKKIF